MYINNSLTLFNPAVLRWERLGLDGPLMYVQAEQRASARQAALHSGVEATAGKPYVDP